MSKLPVSVFMIIKNEEENLQECLENLLWAAELIIVDTGSSDKSIEIAKKFTDKVFIEKWEGFGKTKNKALLHTNLDWVFSIDADERVTNDLKKEIEIAIKNERIDGYYIKRLPYFLGKPVFHGGWYPGWVLRLFKKKKGRFSNKNIHEKIQLEGKTAFLENDLIHLTYPTVEEYIRKLNIYTTISAKEVLNDGKQAKMIDIFVRPAALFIKMYFLKMGFLDGINGFILAVFSSIYPLLKYSKAYFFEKKRRMNDKKKNRKILVIKSRGLGDTILMIPFLENLKSYFSESDIDVMINEKYINLLKSIDFI
ncbi:MAG: glycosyltransferase, partial [Candidatus Coatesbacteria bacterium]|nr:glycosyltransferase [Candidatus Coatesbacteria bacterium]